MTKARALRRIFAVGAIYVIAVGTITSCDAREAKIPRPGYTSALPVHVAMPAPAAGPFTTTGRGPAVPEDHAWMGAFVGSPNTTSNARIASVDAFQQLIGRKVAIVHTFHTWNDFPSTFDYSIAEHGQIDMVSWGGTDTRSIEAGTYDRDIRRFADAVQDFGAPILLRFRWEMDRPNLAPVVHSPADYIGAWDHVRKIFTEEGATNAGWVWCPTSTAFSAGTAASYYPGDAEVDWVCADVYPDEAMPSFADMMAPVLAFAKTHPRPVLVGEFGVRRDGEGPGAPANEAWLGNVASVLKSQPQIKAVTYFESTSTKPPYDYTVDAPFSTLTAFRSLAANPALSAPDPN